MGVSVSKSRLVDRLNAVRDLFGEVIAELEHAAELLAPAEILAAADGVEAVSRQAGYAQLIAARAIEEQVFAELQNREKTEFRHCAEFLQARLRIRRSEARRRLNLAAAVLPGKTLTGDALNTQYQLLGSLAAHAVTDLPALQLAVTAMTEAAVKTRSNADQTSDRQPAMEARTRTLELMEASLAEALTDHDPDFLAPLIRRWDTLIDQDGTVPDEAELRHRQGLFRRESRRGLTRFELWADQIQTETLLTVNHAGSNPRAGDAEFRSLDARSLPQRHLDTLISALSHSLRNRALPQAGGQTAQLIVTIDYPSLAAQLAGNWPNSRDPNTGPLKSGGKAALQFTGPVQPALVRRLACEAGIIPVVLAGDGEVLDLGRKQRLFSPAQRRALISRDKGCAFPACTIPASWCEAHHIKPWQHGGVTSIANGALLCSHHHHLIHQGHWRVEANLSKQPATELADGDSANCGPDSSHPVNAYAARRNPEATSPRFIPPRWIDPHQSPRQNRFHQL